MKYRMKKFLFNNLHNGLESSIFFGSFNIQIDLITFATCFKKTQTIRESEFAKIVAPSTG